MLTIQDRENVIRALNVLMNSLLDLREDLENADDESLRKRLGFAQKARTNWLNERGKADWTQMPGDMIEKPTFMESLFGSKLGKMGKKKE